MTVLGETRSVEGAALWSGTGEGLRRRCSGRPNAGRAAKSKPETKGIIAGARAQEMKNSTNLLGFQFLSSLE